MSKDLLFNRTPLTQERGIHIFSSEDFYWNVNIRRTQVRDIAESLALGQSISSACEKAKVPPNYIAAYQRSDWIYFLPIPEVSDRPVRILDLGAGFGNITIPLAKHLPNAEIYAVDASLDILQVLRERARQEGCTNIYPTKVDVFEKLNLPFPEKSFDLILMNGVLEWIGAGVKDGNPRDHQVRFLTYARRLLSNEGSLYIGIEGRFFPGYFMRVRDPHSQLFFTSVVPRRVADFLCRRKGLSGYRTYTYSIFGYRRLLAESGFPSSAIETLYPIASYKDPYFVFSYKDTNAYTYAFNSLTHNMFPSIRGRLLYRFLRMIGGETFFAPSYLFIARNHTNTNEHLRLLFHTMGKPAEFISHEPLKILGNRSDEGSAPLLLINKDTGKPTHVVKVKRIPDASGSWSRNWEELSERMSTHIVQPIMFSNSIAVFPFIEGRRPSTNAHALRNAIELIHTWHIEEKPATRLLGATTLSYGAIHGDYTLDNIIITAQNDWNIIDWEDRSSNWQIFDVCSLLLNMWLTKNHLPVQEIPAHMLSTDTLNLMRIAEKKLDAESMKNVWETFLEYTVQKWSKRHVGRSALYQEIYEKLILYRAPY